MLALSKSYQKKKILMSHVKLTVSMFQTAKSFLVFLTFGLIFEGFCNQGLIKVVITSIEKRFHLKSTDTGTIASTFDIGSLLLMIPICYFGGKAGANRPRLIALGLMMIALGALIWTIPHFATPVYNPEENTEAAGSLSNFFYVFLLAQFLIGCGYSPLETLGIAYIDDNVDSTTSSVYIAVAQTGHAVLGPAAGFVLGSQMLNLHTEIIQESIMTPSSSLWVGAWWPGFLITSIGSLLCSSYLFSFPISLNPVEEAESKIEPDKDGVLKELYSLLTNFAYMFITLSKALDFFIVTGLSTFLPKYIEHQYGMSSANSGLVVGLLVITAGATGGILSGFFIKKFVNTASGVVTTCVIAQSLALPLWFIFLLSCPNLSYVGVSTPSSPLLSSFDLTSECNMNMSCSTSSFDPVCGSDGLMYLSPCLAGCQETDQVHNNFTDCLCISGAASASRQLCDVNCGYLIPFVLVGFMVIFLTYWINTPSTMALMRCVKVHQKSLALGFSRLIVGLFGGIPGPVLFGYFIDQCCLIWNNGEI